MSTTLIYGPPCGGKTSLVSELKVRGDLVQDFDHVHSVLSGLDPYTRVEDVAEDLNDLRLEVDTLGERLEELTNSVSFLLMVEDRVLPEWLAD